jgi:glycine cleavage system H protein
MNVAQNLLYTKEHEWVKIEGNLATIGISDHAQHALGDITFIELPEIGAGLAQFKQYASVESVKAVSDVYAPLSGKVVKVNQELANRPEIINQSPYTDGWIAVIEINNPKEKEALLDASTYVKYLESLS